MPYLACHQESTQPASLEAVFPFYKLTGWPIEPKKIPVVIMNWAGFTSASLKQSETIQIWQEAGSSTVCFSQAESELLERLYTFKEREEVLWFLERYPFLVSLLLDAYEEIGNYFPYSQVFLEVITDPEATEDSQLVIFIATNLDPDEADDRLERFDEAWWLDALDQVQGKLCIDVEFR